MLLAKQFISLEKKNKEISNIDTDVAFSARRRFRKNNVSDTKLQKFVYFFIKRNIVPMYYLFGCCSGE